MALLDGRTNRLGIGLLAASLVALLAIWPPPALGYRPLFGYGSVFLAAPLSFVALLIGVAGGGVIGWRFARGRKPFGERLAVGVASTVVPAVVESAYLVEIVGFGPGATVLVDQYSSPLWSGS